MLVAGADGERVRVPGNAHVVLELEDILICPVVDRELLRSEGDCRRRIRRRRAGCAERYDADANLGRDLRNDALIANLIEAGNELV